MPAKNQRPKFSGALNEPIVRTNPLALAVMAHGKPDSVREAIWKTEADKIAKQRAEKLQLLLEYYKIPATNSDPFLPLAFYLARDFVPGMRVEDGPRRGRGRPKRWKGFDGVLLVKEVQKIHAEREKGIADAVRIARQRFPEWRQYSPATLESRYYEVLAQPDEAVTFNGFFDLVRRALPTDGYKK